MRTLTIDELIAGGRADLGTTEWITVDQGRIDGFAEITEDLQWIHIDPERARSGPFGTTIAHGYLSLSLVSKFLFELLLVSDAASAINYGLDRVRFPSPVPAGTRLRGQGSVLIVDALEGGVQLTTRITVAAEGSTKPAVVADVLTRFLRAYPPA